MDKSDVVRKLSSKEFRRLTGIQKATFEVMEKILSAEEIKKKARGGKPNKLSIGSRLLMALEYLREYRTYFHLGQSYGISESACYRNCRWVEDVLIKSKVFRLPGKKALYDNNATGDIILIDVTESPVERPKKTGRVSKSRLKTGKTIKSSTTQGKRNVTPKNLK